MRVLVLALPALLASCALFPLSEADCKPASWKERGYADGFSGSYAQDVRMIPECKRLYGVDVPQEEYLAGWREGHNEWDRLIGSFDRTR